MDSFRYTCIYVKRKCRKISSHLHGRLTRSCTISPSLCLSCDWRLSIKFVAPPPCRTVSYKVDRMGVGDIPKLFSKSSYKSKTHNEMFGSSSSVSEHQWWRRSSWLKITVWLTQLHTIIVHMMTRAIKVYTCITNKQNYIKDSSVLQDDKCYLWKWDRHWPLLPGNTLWPWHR